MKLNYFPQEIIALEKKKTKKGRNRQARADEEYKKTVAIPYMYIRGASEAIRRVLAPLGIRTAMRSRRMKWSVMRRVKDKAEKGEVPGVVYAVGCKECKKVYTGETKRTANQRIREHKADTRIGRVDKSAIAELAHVTGHEVH